MIAWLKLLTCRWLGHTVLDAVVFKDHRVAAWCPRCHEVLSGRSWLLSRGLAEEVRE